MVLECKDAGTRFCILLNFTHGESFNPREAYIISCWKFFLLLKHWIDCFIHFPWLCSFSVFSWKKKKVLVKLNSRPRMFVMMEAFFMHVWWALFKSKIKNICNCKFLYVQFDLFSSYVLSMSKRIIKWKFVHMFKSNFKRRNFKEIKDLIGLANMTIWYPLIFQEYI